MRYEDASQSGSSNNQSPVARDDADALPAGDRGPATGNVITGAGTQTGAAGADLGAEHAHIVSIRGAHGSDSSFTGGKLAVDGQFGHLSVDAEGNYSYLANKGAPENSRDTFNYKLADAQGHSANANLTVEIGKTPAVVHADAQRVVPGADGVVVLPAGVQLNDVHVIGRDLVIDLPGGGQMLIVDGAIFVPQLVFGDVEVPATSLAALLIGSEIRPAAGDDLTGLAQSSGGNFEVPVAPLDPGIALGDLIPPTALGYVPPDFREVLLVQNSRPEILIQTPDQPAGAENATARVDEAGLPARGSEPAGTNSASSDETTVGTIVYTSPDSPNSITVGGVVVVAVGQVIAGTYGNLIITSIANGAIGYSYTLTDNSFGDATSDVFAVVITDRDGDQDTATLTVSIIDDAAIARADVDSVTEDGPLVANGNVLTGSGGNDANTTDGVADTPGADGITLTGVAFGATNGSLGSPLAGAYGSLVLGADGNYVYTLNNQSSAVQALGVNHTLTETFTYTITDGDGDVRSTTLTITINGANDRPTIAAGATIVSEEGLATGNPDNVGLPSDSSNSATASGTLAVSDVDNDALTVRLGIPAGALTSHGQAIGWTLSSDGHVLTGSANGAAVITVTIGNNGAYTVALSGQVDHPNAGGEDIVAFGVPVTVGDGTATTATTLTVSVEDDSPMITSGPTVSSSVTLDETDGSDPLSAGPPLVVTSSGAIISTGVNFGADGPGTATIYGLTLQGGNPVASGLQTALGDQPITLTLTSSTLITGTYNGGTQTAFTIQMNANGSVTVTQYTALEHLVDGSTAAAYDDALSLVIGGVSIVNATATYTDFDGDHVTATVGIGGAIIFRDDGPSIDVTANAAVEAGVLLTTGDDGTEGAGSTTASSSANFGGAFGLTFATGADGAATPTLAFTLAATTAVSGLTSHGVAINLYNVGGVIVGSTALVAPPIGDSSIVFAVSVAASGVVTLTQYSQIDHAIEAGSNNAPFADQLASLADGVITLTSSATIVDNDGDSANDSATINIGANLRFADDGPDISATLVNGATIRIDETDGVAAAGGEVDPLGGNLGTVTMAAASLFTVSSVSPSADAPTTLAYALSISAPGVASGLLLSTTNEAIVLVNNAGVIEGHVATAAGAIAFTVSIDAATGATTLTQFLAVEHPIPGSVHDQDTIGLTAGVLSVSVTATDFDGDTDAVTMDLGSIIRFEDDGPALNIVESTATVVEGATFNGTWTLTPGADGVASVHVVFGTVSGDVATTPGSSLVLTQAAGTLTVNANGTYSFAATAGTDQTVINSASFTLSAVDGDGDPTQDSLTIAITDAPQANNAAPITLVVDEAALGTAGATGSNPGSPNEVDNSPALSFTAGTDALTAFAFSTDLSHLVTDLNLTGGQDIFWTRVNATTIIGSLTSGGPAAITLSLSAPASIAAGATGAVTVTVTLADNLPHELALGAQTAALGFVLVNASEADGDTATGQVNIQVIDDVATLNIVESSGSVVEGATFNGTWTLTPGADGVTSVHVVYGAASGDLSTAPGSTLVLSDAAGTLTVNANGSYSFAAAPGTDQDVINSATFTLSAVDGDGDPTQDSLTIGILDGPPAGNAAPITLVVDEAALGTVGATGSNPGSPNEVDNSPALSFTAGSDALTTFAFSTDLSHLVTNYNVIAGQDIFWSRISDTTIVGSLTLGGPAAITLSLSAPASIAAGTTGNVTVTVTLADNLPHEFALGAQTAGLGYIMVNASDNDGDTATGQVNISVIDDVPTLNIVESSGSVVEGATFNGTWTLTPGADGVTSVHVVYGAASGDLSTAPGSTLVLSDAAGTLTVNANGSYSFAAAPGTDQDIINSATFTLSAVDGDGDPTQDSLTIGILDGPPAGNAAPITLVVDEAALGTVGATGSNPGSPNEVDNSPALSFTAGSDALTTFAFSTDLSHLVTNYNVIAGQDIFWSRTSDTTIVGSLTLGGPAAITLSLSAPASIAAGTTGNVTVTMTLADNLPHEFALGAQTAGLGYIMVNASDNDGDTATGQVNISVIDDVPTLNIVENSGTVVEGATFNGTWTLTPGADGATSVHVVYGAASGDLSTAPGSTLVLSDAAGTLTVNANGSYSFAAAPGTDQDVINSATFTLSAVDGDGDPTQDSLTIGILDGPPAGNAAPITLTVNEAALGTPAATGTNPGSTAETANSPALSFTAGSDALTTFAFSADLSNLVTNYNNIAGQDIFWSRTSTTTIVGSLTSGGPAAITLSLSAPASIAAGATGNVTVTVTLADNLPHELALGAQTAGLGSVLVTASDNDGDTATGQVNIQVVDDVPLAFSPVDLVDQTNATATTQDNALLNDGNALVTRLINDADNNGVGENFIGADGFGSLHFTGGVNGAQLLSDAAVPLTSGGNPIFVFGWGTSVLTATTDATNSSAAAVVFTATLNAGSGYGATSTYTLDFNHTVDDGSGFVFSNFATAPAGQNQWIGLDSDGNAINVDNNNSHDILISGTGGGTVNTSSSDIGSNNQWIDGGEGIRLDFVTDVRTGSGDEKVTGGFNFDGHYTITDASFRVMQGGPASVRIQAVRDTDSGTLTTLDGSTVAIDLTSITVTNGGVTVPASGYSVYNMGDGTVVITGLDAGDTVNFDTNGAVFNAVVVTSAADLLNTFTPAPGDTFGGGHFSLGAFGFHTASSGHPIDLTFGVTATDGDGDTSTGTIDVTLVPVAITPVVLDTNHDGHIDYLGVDAGVLYDTDGDGHVNGTAWVGTGDSILVRDADGNGMVTNASEFVFGNAGTSDLAALHAQYGDQLDASDAGFAQFMAWNDANGNGIADAGELHSLSELGIVSINLVSDGIAASAAGGDVRIAGSGSFTFVNDSGATATGLLADVAFRTVDREIVAAQRFGTTANNAAIVTAAVAAMGLAATQAAASDHVDSPRELQIAAHIDAPITAGLTGASATVAVTSAAPLVAEVRAGNEVQHSNDSASHAPAVEATLTGSDAHADHGGGEVTGLLAASAAPVDNAPPAMPMIVMPSIEAFDAAAGGHDVGAGKGATTVQSVLTEVLAGGASGGAIDAVLAALPNHGDGGNPGLEALASQANDGVSAWDMGPAGHLAATAMANIMTDMTAFHHDAVQPAVNG